MSNRDQQASNSHRAFRLGPTLSRFLSQIRLDLAIITRIVFSWEIATNFYCNVILDAGDTIEKLTDPLPP